MGWLSFLRFTGRPSAVSSALPPLRFRNTLSGESELFEPLNSVVRMYNCGPTVYGVQHIGNMRAAVFADLIRRTLMHWRYPVEQIINITDVGHLASDADEGVDKMSAGLKAEHMEMTLENMRALGEKYAAAYFKDLKALGVPMEDITFPRASDYIAEDIALIKTLEEKGYAYKGRRGVYFDVSRFPAYGKLGGIQLSGLKAGARVKAAKEKRGPHDFMLWKIDKNIGWDSPWGKGFPGWHIECTAMIFKLLGRQIDIHTGGIEHIPVHHNNEIAQAEAATGKRFVRYWLHNDHITVEGRKISKSLGNTVYVRNIEDRGFSPLALRYWFLNGHYRSPMNFTWEALEGSQAALKRLRLAFAELPASDSRPHQAFTKSFDEAIGDDLDTPRALALVWDMVKDGSIAPGQKRTSLVYADEVLGLGLASEPVPAKLAVISQRELPDEVQNLVLEREAARKEKNFARADELRAEIESAGYTVKDTPQGAEILSR